MHPIATTKHWSHHVHDGMLTMWHHIDEHIRSRHFWAGVAVTLMFVVLMTLLFFAVKNAPVELPAEHPSAIPYSPYRY